MQNKSRQARASPGHPRLKNVAARKTWMPGTSPAMTREEALKALLLPCLLLGGAVQMAVGAVEYGVGGRRPFGAGRQIGPGVVDAPRLQFALGGFLLVHRLQVERGFLGDHDDLRE